MYALFTKFCKLFQWWYEILVELRRRVAVDQGPQITPAENESTMPANDEQQALTNVGQLAAAAGGDLQASIQYCE